MLVVPSVSYTYTLLQLVYTWVLLCKLYNDVRALRLPIMLEIVLMLIAAYCALKLCRHNVHMSIPKVCGTEIGSQPKCGNGAVPEEYRGGEKALLESVVG